MNRQRLGVLLHDFSAGGTERVALRLAGEWARRGRDVTIFCGDPSGALRPLVPADAALVHPDQCISRGWLSRQRLGAWAAKACLRQRIDGLFVPGNFHFAALPALRAGMGPGIVLVSKLSNPVTRFDRGKAEQLYVQRRMARRLSNADAVVAMSPSLAEDARQTLGRLPLKIIEEPILQKNCGDSRELPGRKGIIAAGRFVAQKDFALAVRTIAHLKDKANELTILGDGPLTGEVCNLVSELALGARVHLPGRVEQVGPWFGTSRVLLLTSRYEGFPAVAVEALAAGTRIVATDCSPAIREIVNSPELGEVVRSRNPVELAAAVDRQLQLDPVPTSVIVTLHQRYGLDRSAQRYLALFDSL